MHIALRAFIATYGYRLRKPFSRPDVALQVCQADHRPGLPTMDGVTIMKSKARQSALLGPALIGLAALGALASGAAQAQHWHRGGARFGVYLGGPYWGAPYYAPYYYNYPPSYYYPPAPVVIAPSNPPIYIENNAATQVIPQAAPGSSPPPMAAQAPQASNTWYYCRDSQGYYPYVRECKSAWEPVPATPQ